MGSITKTSSAVHEVFNFNINKLLPLVNHTSVDELGGGGKLIIGITKCVLALNRALGVTVRTVTDHQLIRSERSSVKKSFWLQEVGPLVFLYKIPIIVNASL